jgi:hypothetical protein
MYVQYWGFGLVFESSWENILVDLDWALGHLDTWAGLLRALGLYGPMALGPNALLGLWAHGLIGTWALGLSGLMGSWVHGLLSSWPVECSGTRTLGLSGVRALRLMALAARGNGL